MPMIYLEDILKVVDNKYLAVNMAARRARELNEKEFALLSSTTLKPATVATVELIEGKIDYKNADSTVKDSDDLSIFSTDLNEVVEQDEDLAEIIQPEYYVEEPDVVVDPDEREEGL